MRQIHKLQIPKRPLFCSNSNLRNRKGRSKLTQTWRESEPEVMK